MRSGALEVAVERARGDPQQLRDLAHAVAERLELQRVRHGGVDLCESLELVVEADQVAVHAGLDVRAAARERRIVLPPVGAADEVDDLGAHGESCDGDEVRAVRPLLPLERADPHEGDTDELGRLQAGVRPALALGPLGAAPQLAVQELPHAIPRELVARRHPLQELRQMQIGRLQRGVTGRRARNMGRLHKLKAMRAEAARRKAAIVAQKAKAGISAEEAGHQSRKVIETFGLSKRYGELIIVQDLDFKILRGDRVGLIGPNGVGKTTMLKLLLDELERDSGNVILNPALRITYLDQTRDTLRPRDTLWEALAPQGGDSIMVQGKQRHVAAYAKDFLFKPDQLRQAVGALSGGERNRLTLAIALAQSTDVLVLDEPTNDLDMQTLDLLEDMLMNFEGTLILVSHDRAFLDATVTSCLVPLGEGRWVETAGGWTDAQSQIRGKPGKASKAEKKAKSAKPKPSEPKKATKLSFKDQHRLKEVEAAMPQLESEISELEGKLSDANLFNNNPDEFQRINTRLEAARGELEQAELDWMEIEEKKEALAG